MYSFVRGILIIVAKLLFFYKLEGIENIPDEGRAVVCANHTSYWDPVMVGVALKRKPGFIAKEELFRFKPFGTLLKSLGAFPLKRGSGDLGVVKTSVSILRQDGLLVIFPEGTRAKNGIKPEPKTGAIRIAKMADSPIIPVGIGGGYKLFKRVTIRIGEKIALQYTEGKKTTEEDFKTGAREVMNTIYHLAKED